jgi:hypothetical protein
MASQSVSVEEAEPPGRMAIAVAVLDGIVFGITESTVSPPISAMVSVPEIQSTGQFARILVLRYP